MISVFILIATFLLGLSVSKVLNLKFYKLEFFSFAAILGIFFFTWLSFLSILFFGYKFGISLSILISLIAFYFNKKKIKLQKYKKLNFIVCFLFFLILFSWLFYSHMFMIKSDGWYSGGGAWGDLALHATYANKFANQNKFELTNPIYASQKTSYPFLIDFYSGLLLRYGLNLQLALILPSLILTLSGICLLYFLVLRISKSAFASTLAIMIFYFNGGLGFYYFFQDYLNSKQNLLSFLLNMKVEYAHLADKNIHWSNIIADYLLPQRGFVIGLSIFLLVLNLWQYYFQIKNKKIKQKLLILSAIIIGLTPLFHSHTFLALTGLFIWINFWELINKKINIKFLILNFICLSFLAFLQLHWQVNGISSANFLKLNFFWMKAKDTNLLMFWLKNMGLGFAFLTLGNLYFYLKIKSYLPAQAGKFIKLVLLPLLILFLICNVITFQPHVYDNMKLMIYAWLTTSITAAILLEKLFKRTKLIFIIIFIFLNLTGFLSVLRESYTSWKIAGKEDLAISKQIQQLTLADSIFLTADSHNHPVTMLSGRSTIMGYRGWLWTHGINYSQTERDVTAMLQGRSNAKDLLKKYKINYVYIGESEKNNFDANQEFFDKNFERIISSDETQIYLIVY